jgi:hypothetical protein
VPEAPPDPGVANPRGEELVEEGGGLVRSCRELLQPPAAQQGNGGGIEWADGWGRSSENKGALENARG